MRDPQQRDTRTGPAADSGRREVGILPLVIGAVVVILLVLWFALGADVPDPVPLPDSPAAHGTAGQPAGTTGAAAEPGAPVGSQAPAGTEAVQPNPDLAPGTGVDTTRGSN
ncbi:hypothetical protein [Paracoccus luteus]|uniref:hypothetical protein n=1 Tax=Paracoccus luteus TaxID=2508543 RepID=UPI0010704D28|nr:hypothetical protein [Paracoccus luteus]